MSTLVNIPNVGVVRFPDSMSDAQIEESIARDIESGQNRAQSAAAGFMQGGGVGIGQRIAGLARALGSFDPVAPPPGVGSSAALNQVMDAARRTTPDQRQAAIERSALFRAGRAIEEGAREAFPTNPRFAGEFWADVLPQSGGQLVPTVAEGLLAGRVAAGAGYGLSAGQALAQEAVDAGRPDLARRAFAGGAALGGVSEGALGVAGSLARYAGMGQGTRSLVRAVLGGGARESAQEGMEQIGQNAMARYWDPTRPLTEGVGTAMAAGGLLGGAVAGGASFGQRNDPEIPEGSQTDNGGSQTPGGMTAEERAAMLREASGGADSGQPVQAAVDMENDLRPPDVADPVNVDEPVDQFGEPVDPEPTVAAEPAPEPQDAVNAQPAPTRRAEINDADAGLDEQVAADGVTPIDQAVQARRGQVLDVAAQRLADMEATAGQQFPAAPRPVPAAPARDFALPDATRQKLVEARRRDEAAARPVPAAAAPDAGEATRAEPATAAADVPQPAPDRPKRKIRSVAMTKLRAEEEIGGPDLISFLLENKIISKSKARQRKGRDWFRRNASLWDDAPARLSALHHNKVFADSPDQGSWPDLVAQRAYEAKLIPEPTPSALWAKLIEASSRRAGYKAEQRRLDLLMDEQAKEAEFQYQATKPDAGDITIDTLELAPGDVLEIDGTELVVRRVDYVRNEVTLENGERWGVQRLPTGEVVYADKFYSPDAPADTDADADIDNFFGEEADTNPEAAATTSTADKAISALQGLKVDTRGKVMDAVQGIPVIIWNGAIDVAILAIRAGRAFSKAIDAAVAHIRERHTGKLDEAPLRAALEAAMVQPVERQRQHVTKIDDDPAVGNSIKSLLANRSYEPLTEKEALDAAQARLDAAGTIDAAVEEFVEGNMPEGVRSVLGDLIFKSLATSEMAARRAGRTDLADQIAADAAAIMDRVVNPRTTELAQGLRHLALFGSLTPQGAVRFYRNTVDRAGRRLRDQLQPVVNAVGDAFRRIHEGVVDQLFVDPKVQEDARTAVEDTILESPETAAAVRQEAADSFGPTVGPVVADHFAGKSGPGSLADKLQQQMMMPLDDARKQAARVEQEWTRRVMERQNTVRRRVREIRKGAAPSGNLDRAIHRQLRSIRQRLGDVVRRHFLEQRATGRLLADRLVQESGLTGSAGQMLAESVQARFAALASARKRRVLEHLTSKVSKQIRRKSVADRLVEFSNLGGFDTDSLWGAVADKFGLPAYSPEVAGKIVSMSNALQMLPDGSVQRLEASQNLLNFIARQKGISPIDLGWAIWYANTLSGPMTQAVNALANVENLALNVGVEIARRPGSLPAVVSAVVAGLKRGKVEAANVLRTGVNASRVQKLEGATGLEAFRGKGAVGKAVESLKYVARLMQATDTLFYMSAREVKRVTLAREVARREGLKGSALDRRVSELMGDGREAQAEAQLLVEAMDMEAAGLTADANWRARRIAQLKDQAMPSELAAVAHEYALRATFNNRPYGLLGAIARGFNSMRREAPVLNAVMPFVNIIANVANESLNYTPVGTLRASMGQMGPRSKRGLLYDRPATAEEFADAHAKAALGTLLLGAVAVQAAQGIGREDEPDTFQLFGPGPADRDRREQLRQTGWLPYSIRIGGRYFTYGHTPLAIPLAAIGNYLDARRYRKLDEADLLHRTAFAALSAADVLVKQSFLDSAAGLLGAIDRTSPKTAGDRFVQEFGRSASSLVIPNAVRQIERAMDPTVYTTPDVTASIVGSIPWARRLQKPAINALGEPIQRPPSERLTALATDDRLARVIAAQQAWIPVPEPRNGLTPEDVYEIMAERGPRLRQLLEARLDQIERAEPDVAAGIVRAITAAETQRAKAKLRLMPSQVERRSVSTDASTSAR